MEAKQRKEKFLARIVTRQPNSPAPVFLIFQASPQKGQNSVVKNPKVPRLPAPTPPPGLSPSAVKLLSHVGLKPLCFVTQRYHELNLNLWEGKAALEELLADGDLKIHRIPRLGRGGQYQALELLEKGKAVLGQMGITAESPVLKGGFMHDFYGRLIGRWAEAQKFRHCFEWKRGAKIFDLGLETPEGATIGVEIIITGSCPWNAQQLVKALEVPGVNQVYVVCEGKELRDRLQAELNASGKNPDVIKKARFFLCAQFV